ncbi:O-antigen ligase family protein [Herbaspirillum sp. alder98]|uniref:O-antigen ligase family protein n=1 Tax=Herbaspirillum sp. alder98 TaxID=2913096 RepID=UPI001CD9146F|nr:O-antigen ligase family protein [Herbaspirillum sp. alder98]MCA1324809.1 O-antigen ligase family protein [Herbaspirillum sp. alder98]
MFLFSAIALVVPSGFSLGALLLLLGALALVHPAARRIRPDRTDWLVISAFLLYFAVNVINNLIHHAQPAEYDAPLRFALAVPALLLLRAYPPRSWALWSGAALGGIGAGLLSLWLVLAHQVERPSGSTNPIQYGNISLVLAVLCLSGLTWAIGERRGKGWLILLTAGAVLAGLASLLSGSRGSWLALPVCLAVAIYLLMRADRPRLVVKILAGTGVGMALLWALPQSGLRARTEVAFSEAGQYQQRREADSSIGARLDMLRTGLMMAPGHLLIGWGKQGMFNYKASLVDQGLAAASIREHTHLHNEYLDALVKRGIPGLLALVLLYLMPLVAFVQAGTRNGTTARPYAIAATMLLLSYLAFGMTQAFLTHNNGVMILAFLIAILWGLVRRPPLAAAP